MKIEVDVLDSDLTAAINAKVKEAIRDRSGWSADQKIKNELDKFFDDAIKQIVVECMRDMPTIRQKVIAQIEKKITNKLNSLDKAKGGTLI